MTVDLGDVRANRHLCFIEETGCSRVGNFDPINLYSHVSGRLQYVNALEVENAMHENESLNS